MLSFSHRQPNPSLPQRPCHANWRYNEDFSGLHFSARKGSDPNEPLSDFEVSQLELGFWQALARCVSYVAFSHATNAA
jgi:hypothetical protein